MENKTLFYKSIPNILVVDDVPENLQLLYSMLNCEGYNIRPVPGGELALNAAEKEKPDLILLDIMMPGMDGFEVCRRLKEKPDLKDIPVIFISALGDTNSIVKAFKMGGVDYISKPFQEEEVKSRILTHLKLYRQNKELQELNATKDKFFSIIAHDLRSPFNGFLGLTNMLVEEFESFTRTEIQKFSVILKDSASNLYSLLENLLEWARLHRGITSFEPETISVKPLISECILSVLDSANKKELVIRIEIPTDLEIFADKYMLNSTIRNLLSNAVKFTVKGGEITIGAQSLPNNSIEFFVRDSGIGMNSKLMNNLFRIDVQTGRKGTEDEPSNGLGLVLCRDFIEKHKGKIRVESEEGKGSIFYFNIPSNTDIVEQDIKLAVSEIEKTTRTTSLKILIADDDAPSQFILTRLLKDVSREFLHAKTGIEAVELCRNNPDIDLIIMDILMPQMNGYDATLEIRQFNKDSIIIAQSAQGLQSERKKAIDTGCNDYLSKPINKVELIGLIRKYFSF